MLNKKVKFLVMDVDGTLTDGKIYMGEHGEVMKAFSIKDGCGIHDIAIPNEITPVIITGRRSKILENRASELGITELHQGISNKWEALRGVVNDMKQVAYIGDDINDLDCMRKVKESGGLTGCPKDAVKNVKAIADFVSEYNGGEGAVRDFIEWIVGV